MTETPSNFAPRCLSIDLEVGIKDSRIHHFAAVRGDNGEAFVGHGKQLQAELSRLDEFAVGVAFLLGHNLIAFDAPHLTAANPYLGLLKLPQVDTLLLNPLAFPRNPYHHLVKHYQNGQLQRGRLNDPELDARLTLDVFRDQQNALQQAEAGLLTAWHWLTTLDGATSGCNSFFTKLRNKPRPTEIEACEAIAALTKQHACQTHTREILEHVAQHGWALAYALAWLSVAGGNSVMPPWVRHQFPEAGLLVRRLRDTPCDDSACAWCRERHDARSELKKWFPNVSDFRAEPKDTDGRPLQQAIVESAMRGEHVLGILPTGTGKSLCYQIPALSRYDKTGALTVVISPLVALMADQVAGLEAKNITCCAAVNGLLSMPERSDVLDRVRLGDVGILIIAPEQLRSKAVRRVLAQREIGAWVLDEAHCLSKWGNDFRPDDRYVSRFIKESAGSQPIPPVLCLTATAKPDVVADIMGHFQERLGIALKLFDGGASRSNLDFTVVPTTPGEKLAHIHQVLMQYLPPEIEGGAIVYCASRRQTEEVAEFLREKGIVAAHFHAGLQPETKKNVQQRFIAGELRVIAATNAFGMGIDKPDVRLVIHADIPGSLENYLQEAGRAGRDQQAARCVLLFTREDVEKQFGMSARSKLTQREIHAILKSLRRLERKKHSNGEVVATAGEILAEEDEGVFERDSTTDDTRVRTAVSWLEEAKLLTREENHVQVFPSSLRVASVDEARTKLSAKPMAEQYRTQLLRLVETLMEADADEGISTDELMGAAGMSAEQVRTALYDLEKLGIASNDTALTAFVHSGVARASNKRLEEAAALETALIAELRERAPDLMKGEASVLHLRHAAQHLKDAGHEHALPERLWRILRSLASDGRSEDGGTPNLRLKRLDAESVQVWLQREWTALEKTAELRRAAAQRLLEHLLATLPSEARGTDLLAETTMGKLAAAIDQDFNLKLQIKDTPKLAERALLWLHEQEVIRLNKGLAVFRPAMTIHLSAEKRGFTKEDFKPLQLHYDEKGVQIHVMAEYAQLGLEKMADALRLAMEYFNLEQQAFLQRWFPGREKEIGRQTTPESWRSIVESLQHPIQQRIVTDERERTNVLVLAGPGSGKTRVLVHRIAYLIRVRRANPRGILALAYNRHAAVEIRRRLAELIGEDAKGVTVRTVHSLAMSLVGASFAERAASEQDFTAVLREATALLKGEGLSQDEADEQRERLLRGFRWILVDEYQDVGEAQYELIAALAGRTLPDEDGKLSLFAVGDDDQNIYTFAGASVEFIRRFEQDYKAKPEYLTDNYRSTGYIITAANSLIAPATNRMKAHHPITINRARTKLPPGGVWHKRDPVTQGRVQVLPAGKDRYTQALTVMSELQRLASFDTEWNWSRVAVIAREWQYLEPLRSYCELKTIPVQMANQKNSGIWSLRETQALIVWLHQRESKLVDTAAIEDWLHEQGAGRWWVLLGEAVVEYAQECSTAELPTAHFIEWLAEWVREVRSSQNGLLLLTAHSAKGLEFDHVAVLDGGWERLGNHEDSDAVRRLYYVAMTRARHTLTLAHMDGKHALLDALPESAAILQRAPIGLPSPPLELYRRYVLPEWGEINLGFAGFQVADHAVHGAIAALRTGDALRLQQSNQRWELLDTQGYVVGRMAEKFSPPPDKVCMAASVAAIYVRRREDEGDAYQTSKRCDRWEFVVPELVFTAR
jgi:ATP-dependent DNA helicase RecQ